MCGIAGEIRFDDNTPSAATVEKMNDRMRRRGPDGSGLVQYDAICFGQRRLKIFDTSIKGQQPMMDATLGLGMVFNGAIYNYKELRAELEAKGYTFFSTSDTEVLLKSYHAWGLEMLPRLQGMFSFVVWERDSGKVTIARDRLGIKPFYYAATPQSFRFASTVSALLAFDDIDTSINPNALHYYLTFHAVPEPLTILNGIKKLAPGTAIILDNKGHRTEHRYWSYPLAKQGEKRSEGEWMEELEEILVRSIKRRLVADVPVGILLSGGLDSSLLVALIAKTTNQSPETFSIGFESTENISGDEFYYSDMVAKTYNTGHHKLFIENTNLLGTLKECVAQMSEPMTSHDNIGFYLLSKEVSKHVSVVQSGQGADEIFAGYHWFKEDPGTLNSPEEAAQALIKTLADRDHAEYLETVSPAYRDQDVSKAYLTRMCGRVDSARLLDHTMYFESTMALTNGPLARVDNMTMSWGLEARVPFLDHELVEFATRLPSDLKTRDDGKYLLKQLARKTLPAAIIDRPKGYFPVPALQSPDAETSSWLEEVLSPATVRKRGLFNPDYIDSLLTDPARQTTKLGGAKLWQLGLLELWLQSHDIH